MVACNKDAKNDAPGTAKPGVAAPQALTVPAILKSVPADTPYIFANFEPMPKPVLDKIFAKLAPIMDELSASVDAELAKTTGDDVGAKVGRALLEEVKGHMSQKGIEELGLSTTPHLAVYGIGLLPAMRLELKDPALFKALIGRVETKAGQKMPTAKLGDVDYWLVEAGEGFFAVAIQGNELVVGVGPSKAKDAYLPLLLGTTKPAATLADGGALLKIVTDYKFAPTGAGYVDVKAIAKILMGDATGPAADIYKAMAEAAPVLSPDCKGEIAGLVDLAPRIVFGYEEMNETSMVADFVVETKAEIGKDLTTLRAPVPGLTNKVVGNPVFAFGLGLDIEKTVAWLKSKAGAVQAAPYKCEMLGALNQGAGNLVAGLNSPMPPFVSMVKGFNVTVKDAKLGQGMGPMGGIDDAKAYLTISATNPSELLGAVKLMLPPALGALTVNPDGKAVALPDGILPPFIKTPAITMTSNAIGLSAGDGMQAELGTVLSGPPSQDLPLLVIGYNLGKVMAAMNEKLQTTLAALPPDQQAKVQGDMKRSAAIAQLIGYVAFSVNMSERGVVLQERVNWN